MKRDIQSSTGMYEYAPLDTKSEITSLPTDLLWPEGDVQHITTLGKYDEIMAGEVLRNSNVTETPSNDHEIAITTEVIVIESDESYNEAIDVRRTTDCEKPVTSTIGIPPVEEIPKSIRNNERTNRKASFVDLSSPVFVHVALFLEKSQ